MGATFEREWGTQWVLADQASESARSAFISKTYLHLGGAIAAFVGIEAVLLNLPNTEQLVGSMIFGLGGYAWLIVLGAFILVSWIANGWARSATSLATQYLGLGLYVVAEAVIFLPLLFVASRFGGADVIPTAGILTIAIFGGLSAIVFITRRNFSFLGPALGIAAMAALGLIVCSLIFGLSLGTWFVAAMIVLASGYILYDTSNVLHEYHIGQHVAAALALFASVALLFWYVVQLVMSFTDRD